MAQVSTTQATGSRAAGIARAKAGPSIDIATILGVIGAFAVIGTAMAVSGSPSSFVDVPAMLIVVGGTFLVTTISYSLGEIWRAQSVMLRAVVYHAEQPDLAALRVLALADAARRQGIFTLQSHLSGLRNNRFLQQALIMVVDGTPTDEVDRVMNQELMATMERHQRSAGVLRRAGEVAPAMGLIGTLVGLVQMLGNLEDPSTIGPAMAIALLTTFYGAVLANMVFLPIANKLERNSNLEAMINQIYVLGATSISRQENPRRLELMLNTILPPAKRVNFFD
ncbi:MAG: motility protein A [Kiloniellales bacterium]